MIKSRSNTSVQLAIGGVWAIDVRAYSTDGEYDDSALTVQVTLPDGTTDTPTVDVPSLGRGLVAYPVLQLGRYVAHVTSTAGAVDFTAWVAQVTTGVDMPSVTDLDDYLGNNSHTDEKLERTLSAEAAAQRKACRIPAAYDADLAEALLRRCARNLAFQRVPLSVLQGDADAGTANAYPGRDPELRRLEGPYRRLPTG